MRKQANYLWLAVFLLLARPACAAIENAAVTFDGANKLYEEGKFAEAATAYEKLSQSGHPSTAVYFNLGNAFFKSGHIGRAIAAYRQAERISPRDPDVRANLQFARNQTPAPSLSANRWQRWLGKLTLDEWTLLTAAAVWLWLLLLSFLQWRPILRRALRGYAVALAIAAAVSCSCLAAAWSENRSPPIAIVIAPEAVARQSPFEGSPNVFTLHDGAELRVLDQKDEWLQVSTDARRIGWLRREQVLLSSPT